MSKVLVDRDWLKRTHRDLDACQKLIWANIRGADPAYCSDAQDRLKEIDEMLALSQQAEPDHVEDMRAMVEPAPAQGERDSFKRYRLAGEFCVSRGIDNDSEIRPKILDAFCSGYACAGRPTQDEQQPVAEVLWPDEPGRRGGFSQIGHYDDPRLPVGAKLYAAPKTEQSGLVEALERVKLTEKEARHHSVSAVAYWNNAVTACITALSAQGESRER